MSNRNWLLVIALVAIVFISLPFIFSKKEKNAVKFSEDTRFKDYISAYTGGYISSSSNVKVVLANAIPGAVIGEEAKESYFDFSPSIAGKTVWINDRTLEFIPTLFI
jgi:alpha-2-macroglobulin